MSDFYPRPGDVVECITYDGNHNFQLGKHYTVKEHSSGGRLTFTDTNAGWDNRHFRIVKFWPKAGDVVECTRYDPKGFFQLGARYTVVENADGWVKFTNDKSWFYEHFKAASPEEVLLDLFVELDREDKIADLIALRQELEEGQT